MFVEKLSPVPASARRLNECGVRAGGNGVTSHASPRPGPSFTLSLPRANQVPGNRAWSWGGATGGERYREFSGESHGWASLWSVLSKVTFRPWAELQPGPASLLGQLLPMQVRAQGPQADLVLCSLEGHHWIGGQQLGRCASAHAPLASMGSGISLLRGACLGTVETPFWSKRLRVACILPGPASNSLPCRNILKPETAAGKEPSP